LSAPYSTLDTPRLFQVEVANGDTVVWQIKFGGRSPRALLNAISGGVLEIGLDAD
jgi:hypothetical protein